MYLVYSLHCECDAAPRYVGYTSLGLEKRLSRHLYDAKSLNNPKHRWIRKHGPENIRIELIQEYKTVEEMKAGEIHWIAEYRQLGHDLLNMTDGGDGVIGYVFTDEVKNKLSIALLKHYENPEARAKTAEAGKGRPGTMLGKNHTEEAKLKMSKARKGRPQGPMSAEQKKKLSDIKKGVPLTLEHREAIKNGALRGEDHPRTGTTHTDETRAKMREASHRRWHESRGIVNPSCALCTGVE